MDHDKIITEARARIIWGEPASSVRNFLMLNGTQKHEAEAIIKTFTTERTAEIRKIGIRNTVVGLLIAFPCSISIYLLIKTVQMPGATNLRGNGTALGVLALATIYGLWKLVNGILALLRPQSEEGSLSDLSE